jgi:Protein of unknown function (DUF3467)
MERGMARGENEVSAERKVNSAANSSPKNQSEKSIPQPQSNAQSQVRVDTSALKSSYCNVCNATSTREEVVMNFGINHNWDLGQKDMEIQLHHRIILSPFAAKRLQDVLNKLMHDYEARYGELKTQNT